jgi:hypothetical protein
MDLHHFLTFQMAKTMTELAGAPLAARESCLHSNDFTKPAVE